MNTYIEMLEKLLALGLQITDTEKESNFIDEVDNMNMHIEIALFNLKEEV